MTEEPLTHADKFADPALIDEMKLLGFELFHVEGVADWFFKDEATSQMTVFGARDLLTAIDTRQRVKAGDA